jgi:hypothetical protein
MFKQPRVPEYRESEGVRAYMRPLVMFLKDFADAVWTSHRQLAKENEEIKKRLDALEGK